jgi:murein DD-endopeptidase MepM/ murein hydrolase activator NlpD
MNKKSIIILIILFGSIGSTLLYLTLNANPVFDPGDRYESTHLNYMEVIYENQADIYALNEGYSNTIECPWGFIHRGFDFAFNNNSKVLAAAPGQVKKIELKDFGADKENRYTIGIIIKFNGSTDTQYNFEPWTNKTADIQKQLSMILIHEGDWVELGQEIGHFLNNGTGAHVDFSVQINYIFQPLTPFYSLSEATELLSMIHVFHPTWNYIDYLGQPWP